MKRALIFLILVFCAAAAAEDYPLPFMQMEAEQQDSEDLEQQLWDFQYKLLDVQKTISELKQEQSRLENAQKSVELQGSGAAKVSAFSITGPGAGSALDFLGRPLSYDPVETETQKSGSKANETHSLFFSGRPSPNITITAGIKGSNIWAGSSKFLVDHLAISTDFAQLKTIVGSYWAEFTPLTLSYPSYPVWFESELFSDLKAAYREEQGIKGTGRRLGGLWSQYQIDNFSVQALAAKLRSRDGSNPGPRHRFLTGLQMRLLPQADIAVGINWLEVKDDLASGSGAAVDGKTLGLALQARNLWRDLSLNGEYVRSSYNPDLTRLSPVAEDRAWYGELTWQAERLSALLRASQAGALYRAPAAQSRDYALSEAGVFGSQGALTLMGGSNAEAANEALPYGLATPNRRCVQLEAAYKPWPRVKVAASGVYARELSPAFQDGSLSDSFSALRAYGVARIGGEVSLQELLTVRGEAYPKRPLQVLGQLELRSTTRPQDEASAVDTRLSLQDAIVDVALSYELQPGWKILAGNKLTGRAGSAAAESRREVHNTFMLGLKLVVTPQVQVSLTQQFVSFTDQIATTNSYDGNLSALTVEASF